MRKVFLATALAVCTLPGTARAQSAHTSVQGFGGFTFGTSSVIGSRVVSPTFGGAVTVDLTPNLQVIGEAGRMSDIKAPILDLLDFTPVDLRVSAWYGQGGVRFITSPHSAVRPYAEATAGFARLGTGLSAIGGRTGEVIDTGLEFLNRTEPMLGVGGGVFLQGGPLALDLGYRYRKIMAGGIASALNEGNDFQVNEVRIGVGVRF
jgi:hypothetical protein